MNKAQGYKELLNAIEYHENLRDAAEIEYNYNYKQLYKGVPKEITAMQYSDMPKADKVPKDLVRIYYDIQHWANQYYLEDEQIKKLKEKKEKIEECIDNATDITVKVAQLRALGLTQEQVAELVNISDRHVRRIESKMRES